MHNMTMCNNDICLLKETCIRHHLSGTHPNPYKQEYMHFNVLKEEKCNYYLEDKE